MLSKHKTIDEKRDVGFVDILERRRGSSDLTWASRVLNFAFAYYQPLKFGPAEIISHVLSSNKLMRTLRKIEERNQVPENIIFSDVTKMIQEIAYDRSVPTLRWLGYIVTKILKKLNSSLYVNEAKFLQIRSEMGSNPVLLVPSHRSYLDFILLSYLCFTYEVDIPRIAAGMDFHSMKGMGNVLRKACAFFMRRSFATDELYSTVFSEYVKTLVTKGDAAIEFYIEGTRSRTGKSLMPKYGFLSMALKAFFTGLVPDVTILPVNLSYDRVLEEVLFAYELLGVPKPKESTRGFFKALSILNENYGDIYVQFGEPFSVKEYFGESIDRSVHGFGPVDLQELTTDENKQIIHLAHTIVWKQRALTTLSCFNFIALVLNNNFVTHPHPLTLTEVFDELKWLLSVCNEIVPKKCTSAVQSVSKDTVLSHLYLHRSLVVLSKNEEIRLCRVHKQDTFIDPSILKGHNLTNRTMDVAIPLLMLQYYVNPLSSLLITVCFVDLIIRSEHTESPVSIDQLLREFKFLCSVFSYEFVFYSNFIEMDFFESLSRSQTLGILNLQEENSFVKGDNEKFHLYSKNILSSYLPGYITLLEYLLQFPETPLNEREVLKNIQRIVESKVEKGTITHPANLSLDLLSNAFQSFVAMETILKVKEGKGTYYLAKQNKILEVKNKLDKYDVCSSLNSNLTLHFSTFVKTNL